MYKAGDVNIAEQATRFTRGKHAADVRAFLRAERGDQVVLLDDDTMEEVHYYLPRDDRPPTCFKEWFAVHSVWRLTYALAELSYPDAAFGSAECQFKPLPTLWTQKLDECLGITEPSAKIPATKWFGLPLRRCNLDSILPGLELDINESSLVDSAIMDAWFRALLKHDKRIISYIPPNSLELAGCTPQEVAERPERAELEHPKHEMMFFPTIVPEHDHCVLIVAHPQTHRMTVYDPKISNTLPILAKDRTWLKRYFGQLSAKEWKSSAWEVAWVDCPDADEEGASGVFMLVNALFALSGKEPMKYYSRSDILFLRRYIAAVVCMGELPQGEVVDDLLFLFLNR